jgi:hypothetical protein
MLMQLVNQEVGTCVATQCGLGLIANVVTFLVHSIVQLTLQYLLKKVQFLYVTLEFFLRRGPHRYNLRM